jgi:hypothetical protein
MLSGRAARAAEGASVQEAEMTQNQPTPPFREGRRLSFRIPANAVMLSRRIR